MASNESRLSPRIPLLLSLGGDLTEVVHKAGKDGEGRGGGGEKGFLYC